jgi:hypothetical protein
MVGQTRTMLDGYAAGGRYRETVIGDSNVHHGSFGHVPIHTAIRPCGKGSNIRRSGRQAGWPAWLPCPRRPGIYVSWRRRSY